MNILNLIIRWGATGQTARWIAKHYVRLKDKDNSDIDVMHKIIDFRYQTFNINNAKEAMLERLSYLTSLTDFTFSILQLEGTIKTKEMPLDMQMTVTQVIMEELKKKGIPETAIMGKVV